MIWEARYDCVESGPVFARVIRMHGLRTVIERRCERPHGVRIQRTKRGTEVRERETEPMIRILHSVSNMDRAGIETMLMNYYRHMDRERVQFDFLANKPKPGDYDEEIREMGGRVWVSPGLGPVKYPAYMGEMKRILRENPQIRIVHAHNEAMGFYALRGAQRAGLPNRIAHAHNTRIIHDYKWPLKMVCKALLPLTATEICACGTDSGVYYFGQGRWERQGRLIRNAIDVERFRFRESTRERIRREYGLGEGIVIGHVGRMNVQKNHRKILAIFRALCQRRPDARLVLIGVGELADELRALASRLSIERNTLFLGLRTDTDAWYQAMDVFLMPSLFEGLPVVGIEAQASGLPCVFSDRVTQEAVLLPESCRLPLDAPEEVWVEKLLQLWGAERARGEGAARVAQAGYDIVRESLRLQDWYRSLAGENG